MCIFASDACQIFYEVVIGTEQMGVWVDAVSLLAYPLWIWAFLSFPTAPRERGERAKFWLDVATVLLGGTMLSWYLVLRPSAISAPSDTQTLLLSLAYPVGDLVLLLGAATILARAPAESSRRALHLLIAAAVMQFVADLAYGHMRLAGTLSRGRLDRLAVAAERRAVRAGGARAVGGGIAAARRAGTGDERRAAGAHPPVRIRSRRASACCSSRHARSGARTWGRSSSVRSG